MQEGHVVSPVSLGCLVGLERLFYHGTHSVQYYSSQRLGGLNPPGFPQDMVSLTGVGLIVLMNGITSIVSSVYFVMGFICFYIDSPPPLVLQLLHCSFSFLRLLES